MVERKLFRRLTPIQSEGGDRRESAPFGGTREEAIQRLQVGLSGIAAMILLVGLASVIGSQAELTEQGAVPDAAPTTEPTGALPQRDPLVDAGVVPDIPVEPSPTPSPTSNVPDVPAPGANAAPADAESAQ